MENLLNVGDKLTIPTGCKAVIKDNQIVIEEKFKDVDILRSNLTDNAFIFKSYDDESFETFSIYYGNNYKSAWNTLNFRHATEFDDKNYNLGNYYLLNERKEAEKIAKNIRTNFENSLKVKS